MLNINKTGNLLPAGNTQSNQRSSNNSVSFQAGELNHKFEKRLKDAITDSEDAQAFLRCIDEDTITYSPERLKKVQEAAKKAETPTAKRYLNMVVETWSKLIK